MKLNLVYTSLNVVTNYKFHKFFRFNLILVINGGVTGNDVQITVTDVNSENTNGTLTELSDVEEKNHLEVINEETTLNSDSKPLDNHPHDKNKKLSLQTIEFIDRRISVVSITENTPNLQPEVTGKNWYNHIRIISKQKS